MRLSEVSVSIKINRDYFGSLRLVVEIILNVDLSSPAFLSPVIAAQRKPQVRLQPIIMPSYRDCRRNDYEEEGWEYEVNYDHGENAYDYGHDCGYHHDHDDAYENGPSFSYDPRYDFYGKQQSGKSATNSSNGSYGHGILNTQGAEFFEEHHVVEGNNIRNGPYLHENYRVQHEDGSYHGHYLWDANRPGHGHHVHRGSYGMDRNGDEDIHYDYEAEYNLEQPTSPRHFCDDASYEGARFRPNDQQNFHNTSSHTQTARGRKATPNTFNRPGRMSGHDGAPEHIPNERDWTQEDWRSEYHFLRRNGVTIYKDDSCTDSGSLANAWMEMDRHNDRANGGARSRLWW